MQCNFTSLTFQNIFFIHLNFVRYVLLPPHWGSKKHAFKKLSEWKHTYVKVLEGGGLKIWNGVKLHILKSLATKKHALKVEVVPYWKFRCFFCNFPKKPPILNSENPKI